MGVRGLKTFLERNKQTHIIKIDEEVKLWKRNNPDQTPIIVIDYESLTEWTKKKDDIVCGGRHQMAINDWKMKLELLKSVSCSLVFFKDLKIEDGKIEEKLRRHKQTFKWYKDLYDEIDENKTLKDIITKKEFKGLGAVRMDFRKIAKIYGDFHNAIDHDADWEIAKYASEHNAMAVISEDTDFLIYNGSWRLWSPHNIKITESNQIQVTEYTKNAITKALPELSSNQLPLFATLVGNDFTRDYAYRMTPFFGHLKYRIQNVTRYIHKRKLVDPSDWDIKHITREVLGDVDSKFQRLMKESLALYDINVPVVASAHDPFTLILLNTDMYNTYMRTMQPIQSFGLSYYDMRDFDSGSTVSKLQLDWTKRKIGILRQHMNNDSFTFISLMKKNFNDDFEQQTESPIYPEFSVPSLDRLYIATEHDDTDILKIKWKIFAWLMSFSEQEISKMKQLPKDFLLISTTVYTLFKNGFVCAEEADAILYTEKMVYLDKTKDVEYPTMLQSKNVRIAHIYNMFFGSVGKMFAIAGLKSSIKVSRQFDGVYFQKLMENIQSINSAERENVLDHIKDYRIYAEI